MNSRDDHPKLSELTAIQTTDHKQTQPIRAQPQHPLVVDVRSKPGLLLEAA